MKFILRHGEPYHKWVWLLIEKIVDNINTKIEPLRKKYKAIVDVK